MEGTRAKPGNRLVFHTVENKVFRRAPVILSHDA